jgi:LPS sulfotransferase NodH
MIMRNPIRRNYYKTTGGLRSMDTAFDTWRSDASRNPALQTATDDDMWIEESRRKIDLANQLLARENARKNKSEADMLEQALNSGNANLFDEPANEQDEELQKLMQGHVDAGIRGLEWQWSPKAIDRQRKMAFENIAANARVRDQALDEAKFVDQKRRDSRGFALDVNKQAQSEAYRQSLLAQRQKEAQYEALMDLHREGSQQSKQALDLVKDGMDPDEVIALFKLSPRDQQLLRSYRASVDQEESLEMDPMIDYLNERELGMRRGATPQEEGPGFFSGVSEFFGGRAAPLPIPVDQMGRAGLAPGQDEEFEKLRLEAAQAGLQYDPAQRGFYNPRPQYQPPAPPVQQYPRAAAIPLITSQAEWMRLPRGAPYRTMSGKVKRKT